MELIEYRGFNNKFIGLAKEDNKYFIIYGKTGPAELSMTDDKVYAYGLKSQVTIGEFTINKEYGINIPFVTNQNNKLVVISQCDKSVYKTCCEILENLQ